MRSWVFRNRIALERVYGSPARLRPLTELDEGAQEDQAVRPRTAGSPDIQAHGQDPKEPTGGRRLVLYHLAPKPPEETRRTG